MTKQVVHFGINYYLYTNGPKIGGIDSKVWMENGIIEVLQAIILLIAISNLFAILLKYPSK